jgi:hypothetical protein
MKPTVLLDMDGVIYNWYGAFFKMVGLDEKAEADRRLLRSSDNAANLIFPEDFVFQKVHRTDLANRGEPFGMKKKLARCKHCGKAGRIEAGEILAYGCFFCSPVKLPKKK